MEGGSYYVGQFAGCRTGLPNGATSPAERNQPDTDGDGYGNRCDPDFDNDGVVRRFGSGSSPSDLARIEQARLTKLYVPNFDLDGDGEVDEKDGAEAALFCDLPPGPSGKERIIPLNP